MLDVIVVGAGPAGCSAAVQCVRLGLDTLLLDGTGRPGGLVREARLLENYPGLKTPVSGIEYSLRLGDFLLRNGLSVENSRVDRVVECETGFEILADGRFLSARSVILATGTEPVPFDLERDDSVVVHRSILGLLDERPRSAAVIGGGEAALDYGLHLTDLGTDVTLLVRGDSLKAGGRLADQVLSIDRIGIMYNSAVKKATGSEGVIRLQIEASGVELETEALIVAVGRRPVMPDLGAIRGIVPGSVSTGTPGFFLAGDVSQGSLGQTTVAVGQGTKAGMLANAFLRSGRD
jgi:thioredoxin reductase (NADPH)